MTLRIDLKKVAAKLAAERIRSTYILTTEWLIGYKPSEDEVDEFMYLRNEEDSIVYTDNAQKRFNDYHDMFEDMLKNSSNV